MKVCLIIALGVAAWSPAVVSAQITLAQPKSAAAVAAVRKHDDAALKARKAYLEALIAADRQEVADLQRAMIAATKSGDLDEAEAIKAQRDIAADDQTKQEEALAGDSKKTKWIVWHIDVLGNRNTFWLLPNGSAFTPNDHGTWTRMGSVVTIKWRGAGHADTISVKEDGTPISGRSGDRELAIKIDSFGSDLTGEAPPPNQ